MNGRRTLPLTVGELRAALAGLPDNAGVTFDGHDDTAEVCDWETSGGALVLHPAYSPVEPYRGIPSGRHA